MTPLLLAACLLGADPAETGDRPAAERPNVLLILSDDQAWDDYGFLGSEHAHTPHLDRLAGQSRTFPHGYVPTSLCRPSLASILTGRYAHQHGITGNDPAVPAGLPRKPTHQTRVPEYLDLRRAMNRTLADDPQLSTLLQDAGYHTLQTGKWWEGDPTDFGFTAAMTHGEMTRGGRHGDEGLKITRDGQPSPDLGPLPAFMDEADAAGAPWFVWYAPFLPHTPHDPPQRLLAKYRDRVEAGELTLSEAKYFANVERFDEAVGTVLAEVDRRGAENTLVVYACDNGWITLPERSAYAPRSKRSPHEGGVRTPIMLRRTGAITPERHETPVSTVDLARTILTHCDVAVPETVGGMNLLNNAAVADRGPVFGEIFEHDQPFPAPVADGLMFRWVVDGNWKLILPHAPHFSKGEPPTELYDLSADPHETRNLAEENPQQVARLTALLNAWWDPTAAND
ncbi:sulfatase family protein [Alienimonas californiensis]|uniref:Arylsulfatase n=1 Tax=Alienimonas californiensis TaxID=2527989 RepID=A0A517P552_9PLAN|nr:sulfatase-like hydrolase/transferase [Alienimonas californiensis]QDT14510.1 Arylsulfatase [Alienimonas californiensis]